MRIRVLNYHVKFWNKCLTEENVENFSIYACLPHHSGDNDTLADLYFNFGLMYAFDCCISTPKLRLKSLPTPLDSMKRVERIAKITIETSCTNIPSSQHENTIVKTLTERVQELEAQLETQKNLFKNVNFQLGNAKIANQKLLDIIDQSKIDIPDSNKQFQCVLCELNHQSNNELEHHIDTFHSAIFRPPTPNPSAFNPSTSEPLKKKQKKTRNDDTNQFPCLICFKKFKSIKILKKHVKRLHSI